MTHLKKGDIIIADPSIVNDTQFNRSVILITSSSIENEVVGLIINKILDYKLQDIIPEINIDFDVYNGGPVNKDNLYYIHNKGHLIPGSIKINQQLFWSGDFENIVDLINSRKITANDIKFCLGYSGWSAKQLINEVKENNWIKSIDIKSE
ncbi:MAG: YqgE/AlgH family protein, partial [Flavobacteriaceae bacterium]|nr:YqgE/AlgH family protein [Flavobacteriaceae bacterium]